MRIELDWAELGVVASAAFTVAVIVLVAVCGSGTGRRKACYTAGRRHTCLQALVNERCRQVQFALKVDRFEIELVWRRLI